MQSVLDVHSLGGWLSILLNCSQKFMKRRWIQNGEGEAEGKTYTGQVMAMGWREESNIDDVHNRL